MSDKIWFQKVINSKRGFPGFWMCPTPNCSGAGFTFDIFPTDPSHPANDGWEYSDDDELDDDEEESGGQYDPTEPGYAELEQHEDDDIEGEEWKFGLQPGEQLPEPDWVIQAGKEQEQDEREYDMPDERPRVLDWSDREDEQSEGADGKNDIPY